MQLLDQPETSHSNNGSKIDRPFFLTAIQNLCCKLLIDLGMLVVLGHKAKSIFCERQTNHQQYSQHSSIKTAPFS